MDSIASVGHVGNYDNETSHDSSYSDDSWNDLSVEEKECLMFFEETIDSFYAEELEETETVSAKNGNHLPPRPENLHFQTAEAAGKFPPAVSPFHEDSSNSPSPQVEEGNSGLNSLPKYSLEPSGDSLGLETSTEEIWQRSLPTPVHLPVESRNDKVKLGPPTAPKPGKLPPNIILKSFKRSDPGLHPPGPLKGPKDAQRNNGASKDGVNEGEAQQIRMEALAKLGLLSDTGGWKWGHSDFVRAANGQLGTRDGGEKGSHPETDVMQSKHHSPRGLHVDTSHPVASAAGPGMRLAAEKPSKGPDNGKRLHWQLPAAKSNNLKRFSASNESILPSPHLMPSNTALSAGTSKTLPTVKRSTNLNEGHVRNVSLPHWPLGSGKSSSLKRFGASGDNQVNPYPDLTRAGSVVGTAGVPGQKNVSKPRPMSICSENDLSARHGAPLDKVPSEKPSGKFFPIRIRHISAKSPPKGLSVQAVPPGPTNKDHKEALKKLGLLKE
ncbi:specifically androgen-regulated gene protein-like [Hypanus sabinus]|uniref:specifically androgen-regulated gene protein-like n=1 Tax=Hypanus sabinus TaxID=79690 RepID=UPI0028C4A7D8|nr:specifically androgen-regulated gene protein-like [Hypanus sabinus]